jgi:hypothetical protein
MQSPVEVLEVVDEIYGQDQKEVWGHLDDINDELRGWCERKEEPPEIMLSIIERINRHKQTKERQKQREEEEKNSVPLTADETYQRFLDFCKRHGIKTNKWLFAFKDPSEQRVKMIDSMCTNVDRSFFSYKETGSIDKTLVKLKFMRPKRTRVQLQIDQLLAEIRKPRLTLEEILLAGTQEEEELNPLTLAIRRRMQEKLEIEKIVKQKLKEQEEERRLEEARNQPLFPIDKG